jgi:hypothetical protein
MLRNIANAQAVGMFSKGKIKFILEQATRTQSYSSTLSLTSALDRGGWSTPRPGRFTCRKDPVPIVGGLQGRSGAVRKISPPPEFDPRTVQPVANRCTDCAIQAREYLEVLLFFQHSVYLRLCP